MGDNVPFRASFDSEDPKWIDRPSSPSPESLDDVFNLLSFHPFKYRRITTNTGRIDYAFVQERITLQGIMFLSDLPEEVDIFLYSICSEPAATACLT